MAITCAPFVDPEQISAAALLIDDQIITLPPPARHHHLIHAACSVGYTDYVAQSMQGFVTTYGRFVDREEAMVIARRANQVIPRTSGYTEGEINDGPKLFSEDLW